MLRPAILLLALATGGCASTIAIPEPFPIPGDRTVSAAPAQPGSPHPGMTSPSLPRTGYAIAGTALGLRGTPYRNGGTDPASGFDCSGLVRYVFARHGVALPRSVNDLYRSGEQIAGPPEPGDLVFFATAAAGPSHVGIAIGGDEFVHAPSTSGQVRVERLSAAYWSSRYVGAKRIGESVK